MPAQVKTTEGDVLRQAQTDAGSTPLDNVTVTQAVTYVQNNVTNLQSAIAFFIILVKVVIQLQRRVSRLEKIVQQR